MKEHRRAVITTIPFDYLPKLIVVNLVYFAVMGINAFPANNGVYENPPLPLISSDDDKPPLGKTLSGVVWHLLRGSR